LFARHGTRQGAFGGASMTFNELVRLLEENGFRLVREKGSIRYYGKEGCERLIRVDYHGSKEVPTGTCFAILNAAGITRS
jgi:predicted RNA binding protein YcfA (HicA-like mRNA interferase family)